MVIRDIPHTAWVSVNNLSGYPIGSRLKLINQGQAPLVLKVSSTKPLDSDLSGKLLKEVEDELSRTTLNADNEELWVRSLSSVSDGILYTDAELLFQDGVEGIDPRIQNGTAAFTVQSYDESNKKAGVQYEATRLISMTQGQYIYSVFKTGDKPVDLKRREFAYTGNGVVAFMFKSPTYTGGTLDPIRNMSDINPVPTGIELITGITIPSPVILPDHTGLNAPVEWGSMFAAPVYVIGPQTNQTSGSNNQAYASNRILAPNTEYLLVIYSRNEQEVTPRLEWYEGGLDRNGGGL